MFNNLDQRLSHMPFVATSPMGTLELCCLKIKDVWKVHYYENGIWRKLATYTNEDAAECCPTAEWNFDENKWVISFISGGSTKDDWKDVEFFLYRKIGLDDSTPIKVCPADVGFIWKNQITFATKTGPIYIYEKKQKFTIHLNGISYIYRIAYDVRNPRNLLISAKTNKDEIVTFIYNYFNNDKLAVIKNGQESVYKFCTTSDNEIYYCRKEDKGGFEDRHIVKAVNYTIDFIDSSTYVESFQEEMNDIFEEGEED